MEKLLTELNAKLKALNVQIGKTTEISEKNDWLAAQQHKTSLEGLTKVINTLKEMIENKFTKGETEDNIQKMGSQDRTNYW